MSEFTIERRTFLLGAVLAPFAAGLAPAEPKRSYTEFIIELAGGRDQFYIHLSESGEVVDVAHGSEGRLYLMEEKTRGVCGWRLFQHIHGPHSASIRFRLEGTDWITVDYLTASKQSESGFQ
jgi:hypothetical protein